jgi:hypothetical protein
MIPSEKQKDVRIIFYALRERLDGNPASGA